MGQQRPVTERNVGNIKGVIGRRKSKKTQNTITERKKKDKQWSIQIELHEPH